MTQREFYQQAARMLGARLQERGGSVRRERGAPKPRRPERRNKITALDLARQRRLFDETA